jgi:hypothetical protein
LREARNEVSRSAALQRLSFGYVDAESVTDLNKRFLRTKTFDRLVGEKIAIVRGAKGTGKSALFELFTRFEDQARLIAEGRLDEVLLVSATWLEDTEISTADIETLKVESGYDYDRLWRAYVALKVAHALESHASTSSGPIKDLLRSAGKIPERRLLPLLQMVWRKFISDSPPGGVEVGAFHVFLRFRASRHRRQDIAQVLNDAQQMLSRAGKTAWVLFDKLDELYPGDPGERRRAIEGLMVAMRGLQRAYPNIRVTTFIRSDIWETLNYTNKSHDIDKILDLTWTAELIAQLLLKAGTASGAVEEHVRLAAPGFAASDVENLSGPELGSALCVLLPRQIRYSGIHPAVPWIVARISDSGGMYPREAIYWANRAAEWELEKASKEEESTSLITGASLVDTYFDVSKARCEAYLSEFGWLKAHFDRLQGQEGPVFKRAELLEIMEGLSPEGDDMVRELCDVGVIDPVEGASSTAKSFRVPLLYRYGLGLTTGDRI